MMDDLIPVGVLGDDHDPEAAVRGLVQEIGLLNIYSFTSGPLSLESRFYSFHI